MPSLTVLVTVHLHHFVECKYVTVYSLVNVSVGRQTIQTGSKVCICVKQALFARYPIYYAKDLLYLFPT